MGQGRQGTVVEEIFEPLLFEPVAELLKVVQLRLHRPLCATDRQDMAGASLPTSQVRPRSAGRAGAAAEARRDPGQQRNRT